MRDQLPSATNADAAPAASPGASECDDRIHEQLAELLEARERSATRSVDTTHLSQGDPEIAVQLTAYFETAALLERYASGLNPIRKAMQDRSLPERIGEYEVIREIGRGGTAVVYEARQAGLNRSVAIKMLSRGRPGSMYDVERLRFEAEAVAHLAHPGIVPVYEVGEHDGCPWFSMQLYEQGSLTGSLHEFAEQPRRAAEMVETIAHAVHHAHQRGILHRDLKPSNVLLDAAGRPGVADFGLAKRLGDDRDLTQPGELIGTPSYMAPERIGGSEWSGPATVATDVYGLGAILYALLTGRAPFTAATPVETLLAVGTSELVRPSVENPRIAPDLETICLKALEKNPADRYAGAAELAHDLRLWLDGEPILARPIRRTERLRRWTRRHPVQATAAAGLLLLLLVGAVGLTTGYLVVSRAYETAERHRRSAETHAAELNRRLYVSQMSLAHRYLERGELNDARTVLNEFRGQPEQQGFEWRWFDRLTRTMPPETVRFSGHTHYLYGGDFSPDGRTAATCAADGMIRLWDTTTGKEQQAISNDAGLSAGGVPLDENCVRFTPDGEHLVSTGEDGGVRLWSLIDGARRELSGPRPVESLTLDVSADGTQAVAGWNDALIRVWSLQTGELLESLQPFTDPIEEVRFAGGTNRLLIIDRSGHVGIVELPGARMLHKFEVGERARAAAVSSNGALFAAGGVAGTVQVFEIKSEKRIYVLNFRTEVRSLDFSPDGSRIAATGNDGCVRVWSLADGRLQSFFKAHRTTCWQVRFSPEGDRLMTVSSDMLARVWNLDAQAEQPDTGVAAGAVREVVYSPEGRRVLTVSADGLAELRERGFPRDRITLPVGIYRDSRPQFVDGGRRIVFFDGAGVVRSWDCTAAEMEPADGTAPGATSGEADRRAHPSLGLLRGDRPAGITHDGKLFVRESGRWRSVPRAADDVHWARVIGTTADDNALLVLRDGPSRLEAWQVDQDGVTVTLQIPGFPQCVAAAPDGRTVAVGRPDGTIEIIDCRSGEVRTVLLGHDAHVLSVCFGPDGRTLASASQDGTARLWNLATGTEVSVVDRRETQVASVVFSPEGTELAIGGDPRSDGATVQFLRAE